MVKYHISPTTGRPNICRATVACPFGGEEKHYASKDEARSAYETTMKTGEVPAPKAKKSPPRGKGGMKKSSVTKKDLAMVAAIRASMVEKEKLAEEYLASNSQVDAFNATLALHRERGLVDDVPALLSESFKSQPLGEARRQVVEEFAHYERVSQETNEAYRPALAYYRGRFEEGYDYPESDSLLGADGFRGMGQLTAAAEQTQLTWIRQRLERLQANRDGLEFYAHELSMKTVRQGIGRRAAKRLAEDPKLAQEFMAHTVALHSSSSFNRAPTASEASNIRALQQAIDAKDTREIRQQFSRLPYAHTYLWDRDEYVKAQELLGANHQAFKPASPLALASQRYPHSRRATQEAERVYDYVDTQWAALSRDSLSMHFSPRLTSNDATFKAFTEAHELAKEAHGRGMTIGFTKPLMDEFTAHVGAMKKAWFSLPKELPHA